MLVGIVALAAWAATAKPISIAPENHRPEQTVSHQNDAAEADRQASQRFSIRGEIVANPENATAAEKGGKEHKEGFDFLAALEAIGVFVTGIFTVVLALATIKLWNSTNRLAQGAEDASERQLRAYVLLDNMIIAGAIPGSKPTITAILKNKGQTPALSYRQHVRMGVAPFPLAEPFPPHPAKETLNSRDLGAGGEAGGTVGPPDPLSQEDFDSIVSGKFAFYVYGIAYYRDVFGRNRETQYCGYWGGDRGLKDGTGNAYREYNSST